MNDLRLAFYADDFTGATDAMSALVESGYRTVLFTEPPDPALLAEEFPDIEAVGIAGRSRAMTPEEMDDHLPSMFETLDRIGAPVVHYKVCSTFDSSPQIGSIGHAIDIGQTVLDSELVPLIVGVPQLGRYVVFGNHFATVNDTTHRLDRHPVMSTHPTTPMDESDLRRHLGEQTDRPIGLVDVHAVGESHESIETAVGGVTEDAEIVCFDTLYPDHLGKIGRFLWERRATDDAQSPLYVVGSSGVEYALTDAWETTDGTTGGPDLPAVDPVDSMLVVSGSASPVTADQIDWALEHGYEGIRLDTAALLDPDTRPEAMKSVIEDASAAISSGDSVVMYTARGPDDAAIERTRAVAREHGFGDDLSPRFGAFIADILEPVVRELSLTRVCIAGGDTCSHIVPRLGIYAVETISLTAPGSPLCRARASADLFDGLQLALKGGQLGQVDYFGRLRRGE